MAIHPKPVEQHIGNRAQSRLCDDMPAVPADISSEDWFALRDARKDATLCPDCQDQVPSRNVLLELYGMGMHSTAHLYAVPVLAGFDAIRNCSHCRRNSSDEDCAAWRQARKSVAVLRRHAGMDKTERPACTNRCPMAHMPGIGKMRGMPNASTQDVQ